MERFEAKLSPLQYQNCHQSVASANWKKAQLKIAKASCKNKTFSISFMKQMLWKEI
ncbi:hypothetical protein [Hydrocoleum sp. CS-953]|uniref:hypothetical protein n=1 Tax=Hydrocoleum sp. CS-953 TaxID=1671698 RepID=UPI00143DA62F|nr:hypothetical protein [Hydrocoleum sp. CS-953]